MCGIAGFIGQAKYPKVSYSLISSLLAKTEHRGKEATGFWGAQSGENGSIIYHKEPVLATDFMKKPMWQLLQKFNPSVLLCHCREPTMTGGTGSPKTNKNNHPHVSDSMCVGLIHNGKVEEYQSLKANGYKGTTLSECDSEIILRMFERGEHFVDEEALANRYPKIGDKDVIRRMYGIEQIFKKLNGGAMAVAIGERHGTRRSLWLFRDEKRPMHVIDLRSSLGQVFFCSTATIWREAVEACPDAKALVPPDHTIIGLPSFMVYLLEFDESQPDDPVQVVATATESAAEKTDDDKPKGRWRGGWRTRIFKIEKKRVQGEDDDEVIPLAKNLNRPQTSVRVLTQLNTGDEILDAPQNQVISYPPAPQEQGDDDDVDSVDDTALEPTEPSSGLSILHDPASIHSHDPGDEQIIIDSEPIVTVTVEGDKGKGTGNTKPTRNDIAKSVTVKSQVGSGTKPDEAVKKKSVVEDLPSFDVEKLTGIVRECKQALDNINTQVFNLAMEGSLSPDDFNSTVDDMDSVLSSLKGTELMIKHL